MIMKKLGQLLGRCGFHHDLLHATPPALLDQVLTLHVVRCQCNNVGQFASVLIAHIDDALRGNESIHHWHVAVHQDYFEWLLMQLSLSARRSWLNVVDKAAA